MAIRGGTGDSNYNSADGLSAYIPELFARKMLKNFFEVTLFNTIANTDYQGEIKSQGDKVWLATTPDIAIANYQVGDNDLTYDVPISAPRELLIDQGKSWSYKIDDIDQVQTHLPLLNAFASQAAEKMAQAIDIDILKYITVGEGTTSAGTFIDANNFGSSAGLITNGIDMGLEGTDGASAITFNATDGDANNVINKIIDANLVLDEQNITGERWIVLPAWACALLKRGDLRRADVTGDSTGVIRNGLIGEVDGIMVYRSNNVYHATEGTSELFYCPFGTKEGLTFASQLIKTESLRLEKQFGDAYRGLNVYGRSMAQPIAVGMIIANRV